MGIYPRDLLIQFPSDTVFGVLHLETCFLEFIANLVAGCPVFLGTGFSTQFEHHIDHLAKGCLTGFVGTSSSGISREAEDIEGEETHGLGEFLQTIGADGGLMIDKLVDDGASLEEMADDLWGSEVIVHRIVTLLAETLHDLLGLGITFIGCLHTIEISDTVEEFLQTFFCSLQGLVGEIDGAAIVG